MSTTGELEEQTFHYYLKSGRSHEASKRQQSSSTFWPAVNNMVPVLYFYLLKKRSLVIKCAAAVRLHWVWREINWWFDDHSGDQSLVEIPKIIFRSSISGHLTRLKVHSDGADLMWGSREGELPESFICSPEQTDRRGETMLEQRQLLTLIIGSATPNSRVQNTEKSIKTATKKDTDGITCRRTCSLWSVWSV